MLGMAEDARSFAHFVPTSLLDLQLLVTYPMNISRLHRIFRSRIEAVRDPHHPSLEYNYIDPGRPNCFPDTMFLERTTPHNLRSEDDPENIYIHPQSFFSFDMRNNGLLVSLVPPLPSTNATIRFPNRTAFLDSFTDTILDL
ncbi:hypothetical protein EW146_g2799 [Bondarzewia mesenterica]|uniref:Uncharacterized protein n=1 Tax=Bondarzewia mesenterica TaxID=1095465 RepID=A0A4S4LZN9_9AGAM|nr:hypothetical protein EW146_g2799 [Bondarzewia mesenterica]